MKKILLLIPFLFILFQGCLNYIQDVNIYTDGSGKMIVHYWSRLPEIESNKIIDKTGIFNADTLRKQFQAPYIQINDVQVYTDTTDSTMHSVVEFNFVHVDSLNKLKAFAEYDFSLRDGAAGQKIFSQFIPPVATGFGIDASSFTVEYKYTFSGEIVTHNAPASEGRTLIWKYALPEIGNGKTISVSFIPFKLKETPYWIYILSGMVLLIVIIFLFKKKKD